MAAVLKGTTCLYGVAGTVSNLYVQSYTLTKNYELNDTVQDETGKTVTARYDGVMRELTVEGIVKTANMPEIGDAISFVVATDLAPSVISTPTFAGVIESIEEKGGNKEFVKVSLKAKQWESIASYS
jgi:hypothetical protein